MKIRPLLIAALLGLNASPTLAVPLTVEFLDFANGSRSDALHGVREIRVHAGQFSFAVAPGSYWDDELRGFCIDVTENLRTSGQHSYTLVEWGSGSRLDAEQRSLIAQLYDTRADALGDATSDAAFQLGLWEILYDGNGSLSTTAGNFSTGDFGGAAALAQAWLAGLQQGVDYVSNRFELMTLEPAGRNQALVTARPRVQVPEPSGLLLIAFAFPAAALALRLRRNRGS